MQAPYTQRRANDFSEAVLETVSGMMDSTETAPASDAKAAPSTPFLFTGGYVGQMDMASDRATVVRYLDDHRSWFLRCAHPMTATPLGDNGYDLTVGHFGALGYDVEPKIGLNLLPQDHGIYRIETIAIPGYTPPGYEVDFKASLQLNEMTNTAGSVLTQVDWQLDLKVYVQFPRFIHALPKRFIQKTGDHLLSQIVRQVSRCLTHKVQEDFHQTLELPFPESHRKRSHHFLERFSKPSEAYG
jgi:hypothetical protein